MHCFPRIQVFFLYFNALVLGNLLSQLNRCRFFITSSILDLTIVGLDIFESESSPQLQQPHHLKTCSNSNMELGSVVYILGQMDQKELTVGEGKVVVATDNLLKLSTDGVIWGPGSAGFDSSGNLSFMVCDPMKRGSSPTAKSSVPSSPMSISKKKDLPTQFGIPIPVICDWLYQHWEGNLDELSKPKLPLRRLISIGQKSERSFSSFNMRSIFKPAKEEADDDNDDANMASSSQIVSRPRCHSGASCSVNKNTVNPQQEETSPVAPLSTHHQGIPTPEIYESPSLTSGLIRKKEENGIGNQLLDINFPPRDPRSFILPLAIRQLFPDSNELKSKPAEKVQCLPPENCCSEVQSCGSSAGSVSPLRNENDEFSSEGETMYSAETMESRNYTSPRLDRFQQIGRSQSCVSYDRWGSSSRNSGAAAPPPPPQPPHHGKPAKQQRILTPGRKTHSQQTAEISSQRSSHDYNNPTLSSIRKNRNNSEPRRPARTRQTMVHDSPRWMF